MHEIIAFEGTQTIATIEQAHARLSAALTRDGEVEIDLAGVAEVDLAFIQLLLAARVSVAAAGGRLLWRGADCAAVLGVLARAGMSADRLFEPTKGDPR
ncbi:MAG TPA: STAS domain-containing protein [Magnetospirillum sp.]|nr:STAS domain-containing protein [Magnetospirillum sp.]